MAIDSRMSFITTSENEKTVKELGNRFNLKTSRCIHELITTILSLDVHKIWQLRSAKDIVGFDIEKDIRDLINTRSDSVSTKTN